MNSGIGKISPLEVRVEIVWLGIHSTLCCCRPGSSSSRGLRWREQERPHTATEKSTPRTRHTAPTSEGAKERGRERERRAKHWRVNGTSGMELPQRRYQLRFLTLTIQSTGWPCRMTTPMETTFPSTAVVNGASDKKRRDSVRGLKWSPLCGCTLRWETNQHRLGPSTDKTHTSAEIFCSSIRQKKNIPVFFRGKTHMVTQFYPM